MGLAERLAREGHRVTLAVTGPVPGETIQQYVRDRWNATLHELGVAIRPYSRLYGADAQTAYLQHTVSGEAIVLDGIDSVVLALGHAPDTSLERDLEDWEGEVRLAGDCLAPRTAEEAVLEGLEAAWTICGRISDVKPRPIHRYGPARNAALAGLYRPGSIRPERDRIFARTWQYVCHVEKLRNVGDFVTATVADESLIVLRGEDGKARALHNVCAHRAARIASGEGCCKRFSCPYHGWTYDLSGHLIAAPNAAHVAGSRQQDYRLKPARAEEMHGLIFVTLDPDAVPLVQAADGLADELRKTAPALPDLTFVHRTEAELNCNWKVAAENYAECYHCTLVHREFTQGVIDPDSYRVRVHGLWQKHHSKSRDGVAKAYDFEDKGSGFGAWWLWPNFAFQSYPGGAVHVWRWTPLDVDRTHVAVDWYFPSTELAGWETTLIEHHASTTFAEDIPLVEAVQAELSSRAYKTGPLMIDEGHTQLSEHAVAAIQQLWRDAMEHP